MSIRMFLIGWTSGQCNCPQRYQRGNQIDHRLGGIGKQSNGAGEKVTNKFDGHGGQCSNDRENDIETFGTRLHLPNLPPTTLLWPYQQKRVHTRGHALSAQESNISYPITQQQNSKHMLLEGAQQHTKEMCHWVQQEKNGSLF